MKETISLLMMLAAYSTHAAETSLSIELPTLTLSAELGTTVSANDYVSLSLFAGADETYGGDVAWVRSTHNNDRHWFGVGAGHMSGQSSSIITFDIGAYGSLDYKYFKNGLSNSGFYFNTSLRISDGDAFPWLGFGYNW